MKKGMKKLTAFILLAVMLLQTLPVIAFATEESEKAMSIALNRVWGQPGDEVEVAIIISDNPGFASLMLDVAYDNALTLINVEFNADLGGRCSPGSDYTQAYVNPQKLVVINYSENIEFNGILATLTFKISEEAEDCHISDVTVNYDQRNITDVDRNPISVNVTNGEVAIYHGIPGDVDADGRLTGADPVLLFRYVSGWDVDVDPAAIDVDGDDFVGAWDAITLFRYVAGWEGIVLRRSSNKHIHELTFFEANEASCTESGNVAYWHCTSCENDYADASGNTKLDTTVIAALGHVMTYNAEKNASCTENGNIAYWHCSRCDTNFAGYEGDWELNNVVIAASGHSLEKVSETSASCTSGGNVTYWYCKTCEKSYADENATVELDNTVVSPAGHSLSRVAAKPAQCTVNGNIEYWYCTACQSFFSDSAAEYKIKEADTVILATGHGENLQHTAKKDATVYEGGNIEYWYCSACDSYFSDSNAANKIAEAEISIPKLDSYSITFVDEKNWSDSGNYKKILIPETEDYSLVGYVPPDVNGYEFDGWYTEDGVEKLFVVAGTNVQLYARWKAEIFDIEYKNSADNSNPLTYTIEDEIKLSNPNWTGLIFSHWTDKYGNIVTKIDKGTTGKIELEAHWIYAHNRAIKSENNTPIIIIKPNENITDKVYDNYPNGIPNSKELFYIVYDLGTICNVKLDTIYELPKYNGLATVSEYHSKDVTTTTSTATTINRMITSSVVTSSGFTKLENYSINTGSSQNAFFTFCPEVEIDGIAVKLFETGFGGETSIDYNTAYSTEKYEGKEFGRETSEELSYTISYDTSVTESQGQTVTLSPGIDPAGIYSLVWSTNYKVYAIVTYDPYTEEYGINFYSCPTRTGLAIHYELAIEDASGVDIVTQNVLDYDIPMIYIPDQSTGDSSSYVKSIIDSCYYIDYDANGGEGEKMPVSLGLADGKTTLISNTYTKEGYTFDKWQYKKGTEFGYFADGDTITNPCDAGSTIRLKALWKPNSYSVKYNPNGGVGEMSDSSFVYDTASLLSANTFTKTGYTFVGWSRNPSDSVPEFTDAAEVVSLNSDVDGVVILYAIWTPDPYTIIFHANGGSGSIDSLVCDYSEANDKYYTLPKKGFTWADKDFALLGWSKDPQASYPDYKLGEKISNLVLPGETVTLYAYYGRIKETVTFDYTASVAEDHSFNVNSGEIMSLSIHNNLQKLYYKNYKITVKFKVTEVHDGIQTMAVFTTDKVLLSNDDASRYFDIKSDVDEYTVTATSGNFHKVITHASGTNGDEVASGYHTATGKSDAKMNNIVLHFGAYGAYRDQWTLSNISITIEYVDFIE